MSWLSLILGGVLFLTLGGLRVGWGDPAFATPRYVLMISLFGFSSWCWLLAILGLGMQHLNVNWSRLPDANEAVLPFYVLHQSVLIIVGYFVVRWPLPDAVKWLIIAPVSLVIRSAPLCRRMCTLSTARLYGEVCEQDRGGQAELSRRRAARHDDVLELGLANPRLAGQKHDARVSAPGLMPPLQIGEHVMVARSL